MLKYMNALVNRLTEIVREELRNAPDTGRFGSFQRKQVDAAIKTVINELTDGYELTVHTGTLNFGKWVNAGLKGNPSYDFGQSAGHKSELFLRMLEFTGTFETAKKRSAAFLIMRSKKRSGIRATEFIEGTINRVDELKELIKEMVITEIENNAKKDIEIWRSLH